MPCDGATPLSASDVVSIARALEISPTLFVDAEPSPDGALIDGRAMRLVMRRRDGRCVFRLGLHCGGAICGLGAMGPCSRGRVDDAERIARWNTLVASRPMPLEVFLDHLLATS